MSRSRKLLLSNYHNGTVQEYVHIDAANPDHLIMETVQDCEPIIERAKMLSELSQDNDTFRHVMIIPQWLLEKSHREGWFHDKQKWRDVADDPDNAMFRTWPGRLGKITKHI